MQLVNYLVPSRKVESFYMVKLRCVLQPRDGAAEMLWQLRGISSCKILMGSRRVTAWLHLPEILEGVLHSVKNEGCFRKILGGMLPYC